jgi:hypothetical protein
VPRFEPPSLTGEMESAVPFRRGSKNLQNLPPPAPARGKSPPRAPGRVLKPKVTTVAGRYAIAGDDGAAGEQANGIPPLQMTRPEPQSPESVASDEDESYLDKLPPSLLMERYADPKEATRALLSRRDRKVARVMKVGLKLMLDQRKKPGSKLSATEADAVLFELNKVQQLELSPEYVPGAMSAASAIRTLARGVEASKAVEEKAADSDEHLPKTPDHRRRRGSQAAMVADVSARAMVSRENSLGSITGLESSPPLRREEKVLDHTMGGISPRIEARQMRSGGSPRPHLNLNSEGGAALVKLRKAGKAVGSVAVALRSNRLARFEGALEGLASRLESKAEAERARVRAGRRRRSILMGLSEEQADALEDAATREDEELRSLRNEHSEREQVQQALESARRRERVGPPPKARRRGSVDSTGRRMSFVDVHARFVHVQARRVKRELQVAVEMEAAATEAFTAETTAPNTRQREMAAGIFRMLTTEQQAAAVDMLSKAPAAEVPRGRAEEVDQAFLADAEAVAAAARMPHWVRSRTDFRRIACAARTGDSLFVRHALKVPGPRRSPRELAAIVHWMRAFERFANERTDYLETLARALTLSRLGPGETKSLRSDVLTLVVEGAVEVRVMDKDMAESSAARELRVLRGERADTDRSKRIIIGRGRGVGPVTRWQRLRARLEGLRYDLRDYVEAGDRRVRQKADSPSPTGTPTSVASPTPPLNRSPSLSIDSHDPMFPRSPLPAPSALGPAGKDAASALQSQTTSRLASVVSLLTGAFKSRTASVGPDSELPLGLTSDLPPSPSAAALGAGSISTPTEAFANVVLRPGEPLTDATGEDVAAFWAGVRQWLLAENVNYARAGARSRLFEVLDTRGPRHNTLVLPEGAIFPASLEEVLMGEKQTVQGGGVDLTSSSKTGGASMWHIVRQAVKAGRDLSKATKQLEMRAVHFRNPGDEGPPQKEDEEEEDGDNTLVFIGPGTYLAELHLAELVSSVRRRRLEAKAKVATVLGDQSQWLFKGWGETRLLALAHLVRERRIPRPGSVVWRQGDPADGVLFLAEGCLDVIREETLATAHRFPASRAEWRVDFSEGTEPVLVRTLTAGAVIGGESLGLWLDALPYAEQGHDLSDLSDDSQDSDDPLSSARTGGSESASLLSSATPRSQEGEEAKVQDVKLDPLYPTTEGGGLRTFTIVSRTPSRVFFLPAEDAKMLAKHGTMGRILAIARRDAANLASGKYRKKALASRKHRAAQKSLETADVLPHYRPQRWAQRNAHMGGIVESLLPLTGAKDANVDHEGALAVSVGAPGGGAGGSLLARNPMARASSSLPPKVASRLIKEAQLRGSLKGGYDSLVRDAQDRSREQYADRRRRKEGSSMISGSLESLPEMQSLAMSSSLASLDQGSVASKPLWNMHASVGSLPMPSLESLDDSVSSRALATASLLEVLHPPQGSDLAHEASELARTANASTLGSMVVTRQSMARASKLRVKADAARRAGRQEEAEELEALLLVSSTHGKQTRSAVEEAIASRELAAEASEAARGWADPLKRLELILDGKDLGAATAEAATRGGGIHTGGAMVRIRTQRVRMQLRREEQERKVGRRKRVLGGDEYETNLNELALNDSVESQSVADDTRQDRETASHAASDVRADLLDLHRRRQTKAQVHKAVSRVRNTSAQRSAVFSPLSLSVKTGSRRAMRMGGVAPSASLSELPPVGSSAVNPTKLGRSNSVKDLPQVPAAHSLSLARVKSRYGASMTKLDTVRSEAEGGDQQPSERPSTTLKATKSIRLATPTESQDRKQRIADQARKRGLIPSSSFRVALSRSKSGMETLPSSIEPVFGATMDQLDALSDAASISSHSSASLSGEPDLTTRPRVDIPPAYAETLADTSTRPGTRPSRNTPGSPKRSPKRRVVRKAKRGSVTIEGSIKAGTIGKVLDMDLGDQELHVIKKAVLQG